MMRAFSAGVPPAKVLDLVPELTAHADAVADHAIAELPEAFRDVVMLVDVADQSYATAAEVLGLPTGTVRSRLFRARRLLQEALLVHARDAGLARPSSGAGAAGRE